MLRSKKDTRLKYFREIRNQLLNEWCTFAKILPRNKDVQHQDGIRFKSNEISADEIEYSNESHEYLVHCFLDNEEEFGNDQENEKSLTAKARNFNPKKSRKKSLFGVPSQDSLLTLSHALKTFQTKHYVY